MMKIITLCMLVSFLSGCASYNTRRQAETRATFQQSRKIKLFEFTAGSITATNLKIIAYKEVDIMLPPREQWDIALGHITSFAKSVAPWVCSYFMIDAVSDRASDVYYSDSQTTTTTFQGE